MHLACVYNDTDIRIYVDGVLDTGADNPKAHTTGIFNSNASFIVGDGGGLTNEFDGLIDEVIIFDRALSAAEILNIYNDGIDGSNGGND